MLHQPNDNMKDKPDPMETLFATFFNGNLTDAKRLARRHTSFRLSMYARQILGWSFDRSVKAAAFLKGEATFQTYCDAE